jgi:hypothetical protein
MTDSQTVVLGVALEHQIFRNPDGKWMFIVALPDAPAELVINGWTAFDEYADVAAVKTALLALQNGADIYSV